MHTHPITILSSAYEQQHFELSYGTRYRRWEAWLIRRLVRTGCMTATSPMPTIARMAGGALVALRLTQRGIVALGRGLGRR